MKIMKRISTYLSTVLIVCTVLVTLNKANAGTTGVAGSSDDSSTYLNYNPSLEQFLPEAPSVELNFNNGSPEVTTEALKQEYDKINSRGEESPGENNVVIDLIARKPENGVAVFQFKTALVELGVSEDLADKLKDALSDLLPDCQSRSVSTCNYIDVKKLNRAIALHNELVKTTSPETFAKIKEHPYFKDWYTQLTQLRAAVLQK
jgi:hypothetical protein